MHSSLLGAPCLLRPNSRSQALEDLHGRLWISEWPQTRRSGRMRVITMRDRSKNRKPTQRGRYLSIEAIQAVQALKRAKISGGDSLDRVLESKVRRLIKADTVAVLRELQSQGEGLLALQVHISTFLSSNSNSLFSFRFSNAVDKWNFVLLQVDVTK
ncbi:hypothetical protein COCNU_scaffold114074G000010 [Cocos nucifera]|nr:hypothetical protein [Cocos nucifera]